MTRDEIQDVGRLTLRIAAIVEVESDRLAAVTITDREPPVVAGAHRRYRDGMSGQGTPGR